MRFPHPDKTRPAVVLTRNNLVPHLTTVTVAPITSSIRGVASEVALNESDGMKSACVINLHNAVTVPQAIVGRWVSQLKPERLTQLCAALRFALGCD